MSNQLDKDINREELNKLLNDPSHYVTPGAKKYFRRVWLGYLFLALSGIFGTWGLTHRADSELRKEINQLATANCINSIPTLQKYNDLVVTQIVANINAKELNLSQGRLAAAKLNQDNINRLKKDQLDIPTKEQCEKPIIKP